MNKMTKLQAMQEIIRDLEAQVKFQATGHIRTSINVLREEEGEDTLRLIIDARRSSRTFAQPPGVALATTYGGLRTSGMLV